MVENIKKKSVNGVVWTFIEGASIKVIQFVMSIIMARLLMPEDYGVVAIIFVFITISQIFIDGGFATALIQDKNKTERDYSTIYTFNIILSIVCYGILFFAAPYISTFYNNDITIYIRVQSLTLVIYAFSAIHKVKMTVDVNFKSIAIVTVLSAILSGAVGIYMAYTGYGVWALIGQYISAAIVTTLLYALVLRWKPICIFDTSSFKRLFPFGAKLLTANLIDRIYMNLYPIIVGKFYTPAELGYYSRAEQFSALPAGTCADVFTRVTFPVLSSIKDENELVNTYRRFISLSSFFIFPIMFAVLVLAKPIILILLTDKWEDIIVLLQILCCGFLLDHISSINRNLLYVKGRADLALKLEIIKKVTATTILLVSIPFGLIGLCIGKAFYGLLAMFLNSAYTKNLINISIWDQIRDFAPSLLTSIISVTISIFPVYFLNNLWLQLIVGGCTFVAVYIIVSSIFKTKSFVYTCELAKAYLYKNKK